MNLPFSERELLEIADRLLFYDAFIEKLRSYGVQVKDQELKSLFERHLHMIEHHTTELASFIRLSQQRSGWQAYNRATGSGSYRSMGR